MRVIEVYKAVADYFDSLEYIQEHFKKDNIIRFDNLRSNQYPLPHDVTPAYFPMLITRTPMGKRTNRDVCGEWHSWTFQEEILTGQWTLSPLADEISGIMIRTMDDWMCQYAWSPYIEFGKTEVDSVQIQEKTFNNKNLSGFSYYISFTVLLAELNH